MSKTSRQLKVLTHVSLWDTPAVQDLVKKDNLVHSMGADYPTGNDYDLIIGPNCWRIVPGMEGQIDVAVKAARKQKYGKGAEKSEDM